MNPTPGPPADEAGAAPLILIPVSAEDFARRKRRITQYWIGAAVAVALVAGFIYKRAVDPIHAQESFDSGAQLLKIARNGQAILSFDRAIDLKRDFADAYYLRAKAYVAESDLEHAIPDFTKLIQLRPADTRGYVGRAAVYADQKNFAAAIADCSKALALDSKIAAAYNIRGTATREMGDARKALDDLTRAVQIEPSADNYYQRGATYQKLGEHRLAVADFDEVITFVPDQSQAYFARAESRRAMGDAHGAEMDHYRARILDGR